MNWLLIDCFEAERRYFNSSEDIQEADLKRFLHHESVNRNRFAYKIEEKLIQLGIKPLQYTTKKGNLHRTWIDEKNVLTENKWKQLLNSCIKQDERCLSRYSEILKSSNLPKDIQQMLLQQRNIILQSLDKAIIFRRRNEVPAHKPDPKVRRLKAI